MTSAKGGGIRVFGFIFFVYVRVCLSPDPGEHFLLDYSNGVDAWLLTNPAADRFCVLGRPGRYPDQKTKKKCVQKKTFKMGCGMYDCSPHAQYRTRTQYNIIHLHCNMVVCYIF